ncbi:hypothetical protein [uncultured Succinatimonas sp.]|uniref:hypothetical protein n=1 Tax=uncultured Succinatimonas sp. TaxID=1262973 RepID=UPI0025F47859|nr:hypothetical protein [uncultured Succinatimonas sp.]
MMKRYLLNFLLSFVVLFSFLQSVYAKAVIEVKNDTPESCSLALSGPIADGKSLTLGWYVFAPGEEARIVIDEIINTEDIYVFHDCGLSIKKDEEQKKLYVRTDFKFADTTDKSDTQGYEEVSFVKLNSLKFVIRNR